MRRHILSSFGETATKQISQCTFYDFFSQISYYDASYSKRVIDCLFEIRNNSTIETAYIENSDTGNMSSFKSSTVATECIEQSDADNMWYSTTETRSTETSDVDNLWKSVATITTFSTENSDKDG